MVLRTITLALLALSSATAAGTTPGEIEACVLRNQPDESSVLSITLRARDHSGEISEASGTLYWRRFEEGRSRVLLRMADPPDIRGTTLLLIEKGGEEPELYVYLPGRSQVKKITGRRLKGSLFGTDFSYADIARLQSGAQDLRFELLEDGQLYGRPVWVLVDRPADDGADGERIVTVVDRETCVPLRTEFIGAGKQIEKVLTLDPARVSREGSHFVARELRMRDLQTDTETRLAIDEISLDEPLPRDLFTRASLEQRER